MDCLPLNDLCNIEKAYTEKMVQVALQDSDNRTIKMDVNGRTFTFTWFGKQPVILTDVVGEPFTEGPIFLFGDDDGDR